MYELMIASEWSKFMYDLMAAGECGYGVVNCVEGRREGGLAFASMTSG